MENSLLDYMIFLSKIQEEDNYISLRKGQELDNFAKEYKIVEKFIQSLNKNINDKFLLSAILSEVGDFIIKDKEIIWRRDNPNTNSPYVIFKR